MHQKVDFSNIWIFAPKTFQTRTLIRMQNVILDELHLYLHVKMDKNGSKRWISGWKFKPEIIKSGGIFCRFCSIKSNWHHCSRPQNQCWWYAIKHEILRGTTRGFCIHIWWRTTWPTFSRLKESFKRTVSCFECLTTFFLLHVICTKRQRRISTINVDI